MTPEPLLERLQRALWPDYRVERELASGGMGIVFLAHEVTLNRPVAVKIIRPELATAHAAEAFLREARILASVRHPNIVAIHRVGEGEGLHYSIMELIEGQTLQDRLASGPLAPKDALKLGRDLLDGLESVHHAGIVHRDVKPSNVFLLPQRAVLADFGIARPPSTTRRSNRRAAYEVEGTPGYIAPEQLAGDPVTPATDVYAAGVVLYEAIAGRRFPALGTVPSWEGIPRPIARVLQRALQVDPEARWPDARAFRRALWRTRTRRYVRLTGMLTMAALMAGAVIAYASLNFLQPGAGERALSVALPRFAYVGPAGHRSLADSLLQLVRSDLRSHPDFGVSPARRFLRTTTPTLLIQGHVAVTDSHVRVQLTDRRTSGPGTPISEVSGSLADWPAMHDSLTYRILLAVWDAKSPLAPSLPVRALPRTPLGLARFLEAEQFVAAAQWENAYHAYLVAEATDSTCWLCSWRLNEVERWLGREHDPHRVRRVLAHIDSFPPWYASLMRAAQLPLRARLDTLQDVTERWGQFFLGWFQSGDELFHRGPLVGRRRAEAIPALATAARRRPDFGPAWEHLAWVSIAEGDSVGAARARDSLDRGALVPDHYSAALRSLLDLAFAWRFLPDDEATARTQRALGDPITGASPDLGAGPRMLNAFDAPRGAIALGRMLGGDPARDLRRSGLIAEALGSVAVGKPRRAQEVARQLAEVSPELETAVFAAELDGATALLDPAQHALGPDALGRLRAWAVSRAVPERLRRRAAWMSTLLARRIATREDTARQNDGALAVLLAADALASAGRLTAALTLTDGIDVDSAARHVDPFYRAVARVQRADWRARLGDTDGARRELLWHEHTDLVGLPTGLPQAAEIDWAFGSLARWRLARLLDGRTERGEVCRAYEAVARLWAQGEPPYRARADSAQVRMRALGCPQSPAQ